MVNKVQFMYHNASYIEMKKMPLKLTKTPYRVLFIILISVTLTSAYALTITLSADSVIVTGDLDLTGTSSSDDDTIYFDTGLTEFLRWDESESEFDISDDLEVAGNLELDGKILDSLNSAGTDGQFLSSTGTAVKWSSSSPSSTFAGDVDVGGELFVSKNIVVGEGSGTNDDFIFFDEEDNHEWIMWDEVPGRFAISDDLDVLTLQTGSSPTSVNYNRIGPTTTTSHSLSGTSDLLVTSTLEVDGGGFFDAGITVGGDSGTDDDFIWFDSGTSEFLTWDNSESRFEFSDSLQVGDSLGVNEGANSQVSYNRMGTAVTNHGLSSGQDLLVSGTFETSNAFVDGTLTVSGKVNAGGGVDPPYVSFSAETQDTIKQFAKEVNDHEEVMFFWNVDSKRFEVYHIAENVFYTLTGDRIEEYHD